MQSKEKHIHQEVPGKWWEVVGADICNLHNANNLCIVDYHIKFPFIKKTEDLWEDSLILGCKIISSENGLPQKIISDADDNFISDKFKRFCKNFNIEETVSSLYHHQNNEQVKICIEFIKWTIRNA